MAVVANPARNDASWLTLKRVRRAALLAIPVLLLTFLYRNEVFRDTWRYTLQSVALLPLFAYVITDRYSLAFRILNLRWLAQLGILSYSLYLVHAIILEWFTRHLQASKSVLGVATLATAILVSKLLQLAVERPLFRLRKRWAVVRA
jgi:peptidoglycan/LPS O-acetylase OafA/YrhL